MKKTIIKAVVVCTMALSLLFMGMAVVADTASGIAVCHDGPQRDTLYY